MWVSSVLIKAFLSKEALASLQTLRLGGNLIGDDGLKALAEACRASGALDKLQSLYLGGNPVSQKSKDAIKSAMAKTSCSVNF